MWAGLLEFDGTAEVHEEPVLSSEKVSNSKTSAETETKPCSGSRESRAWLLTEVPGALQRTLNVTHILCGLQKKPPLLFRSLGV